MAYHDLQAMLRRHEGWRAKPYEDSTGHLTIGYGRNLADLGITHDEGLLMLDNDIARCVRELRHALPWVRNLDTVRAEALIDLAFNLGITRLLRFQRMLKALESGDYVQAAAEMLDSLWAQQVGKRARDLAAMMVSGTYEEQARD